MRSCGRFGPAIDGTTVDRSSSRYSENTGSLAGVVPQALGLRIGLDQRDLLLRAAGEPQVLRGLLVDREHRGGRPELRAHVADGGAVGQRDGTDAVTVELHELADNAVLAQHFGDRQHQVGGRGAGRDLAYGRSGVA